MTIQDEKMNSVILAGIADIEPVINVYINNELIVFLPKISILVETNKRGIHMSRLIESLMIGMLATLHNKKLEELGTSIAKFILKRRNLIGCESDNIHIIIKGKYVYEIMEPCEVLIYTKIINNKIDNYVGIRLHGMSACPCALSESGGKYTHNQRIELILMKKNGEFLKILKDAENKITPTRTLLKRDEEVELIKKAYNNPKFVEDLVREFEDYDFVRVISFESIHKHQAIAIGGKAKNEVKIIWSIPYSV